MRKYKIVIVVLISFMLTSCIISTAAKVVTTAVKVGYSAVKGTVKGVSWAVRKAEGKISEDRIDGTWKVVGVYNGTYEQFAQDSNPENNYQADCTSGFEIVEFKSKREKFHPVHCEEQDEDWVQYSFKFGKNPVTKNKENYLKYGASNYISVIDVTNKTMVLEGNLMQKYAFSGGKLYLFEKVK